MGRSVIPVTQETNRPENVMSEGAPPRLTEGEKLRELSYLTSSVGHHVINVFSAIVSNAELIRSPEGRTISQAELAALGTSLIDAAIAASQVTRRLMDCARRASTADGDPSNPNFAPVNFNDLIVQAVEAEKSQTTSQVEWILTLGSIPEIAGDADSLRAMFAYLLRNASESLRGGTGTIEVSTYVDPRNWTVTAIRDTGCGMSSEILKRASEPFFSTKAEHAGIGLTIAQGIWRRSRGSLAIESQPDVGTTVRLSLAPPFPSTF